MNLADFIVAGIILAFGIVGLVHGFVRTAFRLASFFIAAYIAISMYPAVTDFFIRNTPIYASIKTSIDTKLISQEEQKETDENTEEADTEKKIDLSGLPLPDKIKIWLEGLDIQESNTQSDTEAIGNNLTTMIINVISVVLVFIFVSAILGFVGLILDCIAKLPLFLHLNMAGGFIFGLLEGLLVLYIICAIISLFVTSNSLQIVFDLINSSIYAKEIYNNNFLLDWIVEKNIAQSLLTIKN